jgi:2-desacetyl-2-hydroxyethyl bacteriochlorophyllide A dehydrogenase
MKKNETFRRAEITSAGVIQFRDVTRTKPNPGEVLIKVKSCALCGSDVHSYKGKHPYVSFPCTFGHELSGVVEESGPGIKKVKIGDRVCVEPLITCGMCYYCKMGKYDYCENLKLKYRSGYGGFADYYLADERWVHILPEDISFDEGALMEPLACAVHAVKRADIRSEDSVCIVGDGPIGLMILQVARAAGATEIYMCGLLERNLAVASDLGAIAIGSTRGDPVKEVVGKTARREGVDISFEAVGLSQTFDQALSVVKKGGSSVIIGIFEDQIQSQRLRDAMVREVKVVGTVNYCWDFETAIDLVHGKRVDLKPLITHRFPLEQIEEAMETKLDRSHQAIKVIINPS